MKYPMVNALKKTGANLKLRYHTGTALPTGALPVWGPGTHGCEWCLLHYRFTNKIVRCSKNNVNSLSQSFNCFQCMTPICALSSKYSRRYSHLKFTPSELEINVPKFRSSPGSSTRPMSYSYISAHGRSEAHSLV